MKKYFITIQTDDNNEMILIAKAENIEEAKTKISKKYHYQSILDISETSPRKNEKKPIHIPVEGYTLSLPYRNKTKIFIK